MGKRIEAFVNDITTVSALLDTGADLTTVKKSVAETIQAKVGEWIGQALQGFGGTKHLPVGETSLKIKIQNAEVEVSKVAVVEDRHQDVDLIVGQDWIYHPSVDLSITSGVVNVKRVEIPEFIQD